jgi:hypothetical protein
MHGERRDNEQLNPDPDPDGARTRPHTGRKKEEKTYRNHSIQVLTARKQILDGQLRNFGGLLHLPVQCSHLVHVGCVLIAHQKFAQFLPSTVTHTHAHTNILTEKVSTHCIAVGRDVCAQRQTHMEITEGRYTHGTHAHTLSLSLSHYAHTTHYVHIMHTSYTLID